MIKAASPWQFTLACQLLVALPLVGCTAIMDRNRAVSCAAGILAFVLPNLYFTFYAFRVSGAKYAKHVFRSINSGEMGKFVLTIFSFAMIYSFLTPVHVPMVFLGFGSMIVLQWWIAKRIGGTGYSAMRKQN